MVGWRVKPSEAQPGGRFAGLRTSIFSHQSFPYHINNNHQHSSPSDKWVTNEIGHLVRRERWKEEMLNQGRTKDVMRN